MPPSKVRIEKIESQRVRQHTFLKRKTGLIKKAIELTILCDCDVSIIINKKNTSANARSAKLVAYSNRKIQDMIAEVWDDLQKCAQVNNSVYPQGKIKSLEGSGSDQPMDAIPADFVEGDDEDEEANSDVDYEDADTSKEPGDHANISKDSSGSGKTSLTFREGRLVSMVGVPGGGQYTPPARDTTLEAQNLSTSLNSSGALESDMGKFLPQQPNYFTEGQRKQLQQHLHYAQDSFQDMAMGHDSGYFDSTSDALLGGRNVPQTLWHEQHLAGQDSFSKKRSDSFLLKRDDSFDKTFALGKSITVGANETFTCDFGAANSMRNQCMQYGGLSSASQDFSNMYGHALFPR